MRGRLPLFAGDWVAVSYMHVGFGHDKALLGTTLAFTWSNELVIADNQSSVQRSAKVMPVET